jgi:hypothetical protein
MAEIIIPIITPDIGRTYVVPHARGGGGGG